MIQLNENMENSQNDKNYTIVLKLGSSSLIDADTKDLRLANMTRIVETVTNLKRKGHRIVIVSSGGIAMGLNVMNMDIRPTSVSQTQAIAAIGQSKLIGRWDTLFQEYEQEIAQILLTRNDILDWKQFKNARNTINELLDMGITPIVNENDTLSISEIEFGDNDTLSGVAAALIQADFLFLLTDVDCLYSNDPRVDPTAKPILTVRNLHLGQGATENPLNGVNISNGSGSNIGTGGMKTKIVAADLATNSGVHTIILNSETPQHIDNILSYMTNDFDTLNVNDDDDNELQTLNKLNIPLHTKFLANDSDKRLESRQFWILHGLVSKGSIIIDEKTYRQLNLEQHNHHHHCDKEKGIVEMANPDTMTDNVENIDVANEEDVITGGLDVHGIIGVEDKFHEMECVNVKIGKTLANGELDPNFPLKTVGRAMVNYTSDEIEKIKGLTEDKDIEDILEGSGNLINNNENNYVTYNDNNDINNKHTDKIQSIKSTTSIRSNPSSISLVASRENLALTPF